MYKREISHHLTQASQSLYLSISLNMEEVRAFQGVRQGYRLSLIFFQIYIDVIICTLKPLIANGVPLNMFINVNTLFFADEQINIQSHEDDFQKSFHLLRKFVKIII